MGVPDVPPAVIPPKFNRRVQRDFDRQLLSTMLEPINPGL